MSAKTAEIKDGHERFHKEIEDFAEWIRIKETEPYNNFFLKIKSVLEKRFPQAKIMLFGSTAANLGVYGSDIDVLVYD